MTILLTGGTGKVSTSLIPFLQASNTPFLIASRRATAASSNGLQTVKFDWDDPATFSNPFAAATQITAVFLVAPSDPQPAPAMNTFIDLAVEKGVKRFVLLAGGTTQKGPIWLGPVWQHLDDLKVEYGVLRPSWFFENFIQEPYISTIKNEGKIYSGTADGKSPLLSTGDIAAVVLHGLCDKTPPKEAYDLHGPELLSYDDVAEKLSKVLGRKIEHVKLSPEENLERLRKLGVSEWYVQLLAYLEAETAKNAFATELSRDVEEATGSPPKRFDDWAQEHRAHWQ